MRPSQRTLFKIRFLKYQNKRNKTYLGNKESYTAGNFVVYMARPRKGRWTSFVAQMEGQAMHTEY
jgi:hypothetical protein